MVDARHVHEYVEPAQPVHRSGDRRGHRAGVADVARDDVRGLAEVDADDLRALLDQQLDGRPSHAAVKSLRIARTRAPGQGRPQS